MVQLGQDARLLLEALGILSAGGLKQLERDDLAAHQVARPVHRAHPARTCEALDLVSLSDDRARFHEEPTCGRKIAVGISNEVRESLSG
jgi:hypothetical protein